jgi:hypothetical protein
MRALDARLPGPVALAAVALLGLGINLGIQLILSRLPLKLGQLRQQFVSFGCGLAATAAGLVLCLNRQSLGPADYAGELALNLLSYAFLGFFLFNAINLNISSLRIRMLKEYLGQHPNPLSDSLLMTKYNVSAMLEARLTRLQAGGQILERDSRFYSRHGATIWIGYFFSGLRQILLGKERS